MKLSIFITTLLLFFSFSSSAEVIRIYCFAGNLETNTTFMEHMEMSQPDANYFIMADEGFNNFKKQEAPDVLDLVKKDNIQIKIEHAKNLSGDEQLLMNFNKVSEDYGATRDEIALQAYLGAFGTREVFLINYISGIYAGCQIE